MPSKSKATTRYRAASERAYGHHWHSDPADWCARITATRPVPMLSAARRSWPGPWSRNSARRSGVFRQYQSAAPTEARVAVGLAAAAGVAAAVGTDAAGDLVAAGWCAGAPQPATAATAARLSHAEDCSKPRTRPRRGAPCGPRWPPRCSGTSSILAGSAEQEGEHGLASLVAALAALDGMGSTVHDHQLPQRRMCGLLLRPLQRGGQVAVPG